MKKPFVVSVSVSFLVLLAGYFFHQEITSRNLPKPDHIKIVSVPDGFILDEKQPKGFTPLSQPGIPLIRPPRDLLAVQQPLPKTENVEIVKPPPKGIYYKDYPIEEVGALRAELEQLKEEFKLIRINSGRMVEQMNTLTKLVHEIRKSPKIAEQTKTIYVPYRETGDSTHQMDHMLPMVLDNNLQLEKINKNLDNIEFQLQMNSLRHGN